MENTGPSNTGGVVGNQAGVQPSAWVDPNLQPSDQFQQPTQVGHDVDPVNEFLNNNLNHDGGSNGQAVPSNQNNVVDNKAVVQPTGWVDHNIQGGNQHPTPHQNQDLNAASPLPDNNDLNTQPGVVDQNAPAYNKELHQEINSNENLVVNQAANFAQPINEHLSTNSNPANIAQPIPDNLTANKAEVQSAGWVDPNVKDGHQNPTMNQNVDQPNMGGSNAEPGWVDPNASAANADQIEHDKFLADKALTEKLEQDRLVAEKAEAERLEQEKVAAEKKAQAVKVTAEKAEAERLEQERIANEQADAARIAAEKAEAERLEQERIANEQAEAARIAAEKAEADRIAAEKAEAERLEQERLAAEKAEVDRIAAEKVELDRIAAEKAENERLEQERLAAEKKAQEEAELQRLIEEQRRLDQLKAEESIMKTADAVAPSSTTQGVSHFDLISVVSKNHAHFTESYMVPQYLTQGN